MKPPNSRQPRLVICHFDIAKSVYNSKCATAIHRWEDDKSILNANIPLLNLIVSEVYFNFASSSVISDNILFL